MRRVLTLVVICTAALAAQQGPSGVARTPLLDNSTIAASRLRFAPGAREDLHTHPFPAVVVQIDEGAVDMRAGTSRATSRRQAGHVDFIEADVPHAAANAGTAAFEVVVIAIKPDRAPAGAQPQADAPPGITRTPVLDNREAQATRVRIAPGAREPIHTHPYDLVLVQVTPGRMELVVGGRTDTGRREAGDVVFVPRGTPHAVASTDDRPFDVLSVGIK